VSSSKDQANVADQTPMVRESGPLVQIVSVVVALALVSLWVEVRSRRPIAGRRSPAAAPAATLAPVVPSASTRSRSPQVEASEVAASKSEPAPAARPLDRTAVARAEAELDAVSRDRERAEARAAAAAQALAQAEQTQALTAWKARKLAFEIRDPSTRIQQAASRGGFVKRERDKLAQEILALRKMPRPKAKSILTKSPVARPAAGNEVHFELRHGRITYIDLDRLVELTKADAQVRLRMADRVPIISGRVGPVGAFAMSYELGRSQPGTVEELLERKSLRFDLRAWEIEGESESRGETFEATRGPLSEYTRVINRLNPERTSITLWVYPDSFTLYRQIRQDLIARGLAVAGRPLPEGMAIRGSPLGSQSAVQ